MKYLILGLIAALLTLGGAAPSYAGGGHGGGHRGGHHWRGHHSGGHHWSGHHASFFLDTTPLLLYWLRYPALRGERAPVAATEYVQQTDYWYYCTDPQGYYPYVRECPQGWMQVVPSSPQRQP